LDSSSAFLGFFDRPEADDSPFHGLRRAEAPGGGPKGRDTPIIGLVRPELPERSFRVFESAEFLDGHHFLFVGFFETSSAKNRVSRFLDSFMIQV